MSDLWDYDTDEQEISSDSSDEEQDDSNTDFLLPDNKRRRLQKSLGRKHGSAKLEAEQEQAGDSDIDLLNSPASEGQELTATQQPQLQQQVTRKSNLDSRTSNLLQKLKATTDALQEAAAADVDISEDDEDIAACPPQRLSDKDAGIQCLPDTSPILKRYGNNRERLQESHDVCATLEEDHGFEILDELSTEPHRQQLTCEGLIVDKINLKLQSEKGVKVLRMRRTDIFGKMFKVYKKYALDQGWILSLDAHVRFIFDGELLSPGGTPASEDLEGDEMIEVRFPR